VDERNLHFQTVGRLLRAAAMYNVFFRQ